MSIRRQLSAWEQAGQLLRSWCAGVLWGWMMGMELTRRGLITGLVSFVAAPAIVRASSLMPVKALDLATLEIHEVRSM
jgi:hypothetical protein